MKDNNLRQKKNEKRKNNNKNSTQNKPKLCLQENKLIANKVNKKRIVRQRSEDIKINSEFCKKIEFLKDKESGDSHKSEQEGKLKKNLSFNHDKKVIQHSPSQDLIAKILAINTNNNNPSSIKNDISNFFLSQKEEIFPNNSKTIKTRKINNNQNTLKNKEESNTNNKKTENNKKKDLIPLLKNKKTKKELSKNKNNICGVVTQDFRKHRNYNLESAISSNDHKSAKDYKYNSSITDTLISHKKRAEKLFGLHQLSENSSNNNKVKFRLSSHNNLIKVPVSQRSNLNNNEIKYSLSKKQEEITQSIMELDLIKLEKEVYDYENTDVTDAINKLPSHKISFGKKKKYKKKNKRIKKRFTIKKKYKTINKTITRKFTISIKERFRILRRVGYVYDSLDDEECEDEESNNFYFEPNGNYILILDFLILMSSLFYLVFFPIHLSSSSFNEKNSIKDYVYGFIDGIFIIDFISGFFTAYINFDEDLVKNSVSIIQNYIKTWCLLDFLCCIPVHSILRIKKNKFENSNCFEICYFNYDGKNLYHLFEMIKILKIIKALKANIARKAIYRKLKKITFFYYWGYFIKQVFIFVSILNLSSCLFIFSARNSYPNWILNLNMNIHNFIPIYICSFYFIITTVTTVGYGDINISSMTERTFEILFLIIGTCLYSWMLTSASNYIKKMNEKNIKFEQKKEILDNIKTNYPLMSPELYRKIFKLLYYKRCHEEVDKNIIIDSLPYSIRNNLLIQMYSPIIKNFKFFRYFGNSEFIIEIVSVLKPLVSVKGDLLLSEGDYVEDIIFNKTGNLSLEINIDLNNPIEFIEQYLIKYNLGDVKNKKNLNSNKELSSTYEKNSFNSSSYSKNNHNFKMSSYIGKPNNNINFLMNIKNEETALNTGKITEKKIQNLKIISIRENEHFGDVLMFLNEPSPLNVRVSSKNAEVLLLSKTDVVKISSNFPNIWKRMNEKSIFNLEQIKNIITHKLSIFCYSNGIKIKSLQYKKSRKNGKDKLKCSLISIPDRDEKITQLINLSENSESKSIISENNSSENFENSIRKNTFVINEVSSSEENRTNRKYENKIMCSCKNNTLAKKEIFKKMNDSINISIQNECASDKNIYHKKSNNYFDKNSSENKNRLLPHSKSYSKLSRKKYSALSNTKNSIKTNKFKTNTIIGKTITNENYSSKNTRNSFLSNSPIINNEFSISGISLPKGAKYQNFAEKSKMNKKITSIPSFNFLQNYNITDPNFEPEEINDEIYPNENFEIKIPDNDQNLMGNDDIELQKNSISESHKKLLTLDKKFTEANTFKEEKKHIEISNNLSSNNKFNNLTISSISTFKIKASYDNINEFTKYKFISNESLIKKTKIFLSKECGFLCDLNNTKFTTLSTYTPIHSKLRKKKSKSTIKLSKCLQNKKFFDYSNSITNLSLLNEYDADSPPRFSKEMKKLGFKKSLKDNEKFLNNSLMDIRGLNLSFNHTTTINKEKNGQLKKKNSICRNMLSNFSPKKVKRKTETSSDNLVNMKTLNKLNLITENMKRDNQNLNNPNEFYADLFSNFCKQTIKENESKLSIPKVKVALNKEKKNTDESEDEDEENCFGDK